jgi:hypothetical protein
VLTDVLVSHVFSQRTRAESLHVARRYSNLKIWYTSERLAIDGAAYRLISDAGVKVAALEILILGIHVIGVNHYPEGLEGFQISVRARVHGSDKPHSSRLRTIDLRGANLHVL